MENGFPGCLVTTIQTLVVGIKTAGSETPDRIFFRRHRMDVFNLLYTGTTRQKDNSINTQPLKLTR